MGALVSFSITLGVCLGLALLWFWVSTIRTTLRSRQKS